MAYLVRLPLTPQQAPSVYFPDDQGKAIATKGLIPFSALPLEREEVPETALVASRHERIPELIKINGRWSFCRDVKEMIEALEPGANQFFAVHLNRKHGKKPLLRQDGGPLDEPYYFMNITQMIDAVYVEKSDVRVRESKDGVTLVHSKPGKEFVLKKELVADHHIWIGKYHLIKNQVLFSDHLVDMLRKRGSKGFTAHYIAEEPDSEHMDLLAKRKWIVKALP